MRTRERILSIKMIERKKARQGFMKEIGVTAALRSKKEGKGDSSQVKEEDE